MKSFDNLGVAARFDAYPENVRPRMLALRELIFETAATTPGVGEIEETLKWNEPAYRPKNKSGTTVRIDWKLRSPDTYAVYFNCKTTLIEEFRRTFSDKLRFEGNRAIILDLRAELPENELTECFAAALRYFIEIDRANHKTAI